MPMPTSPMFGDLGVRPIKFMGRSGTAPSALLAQDVPGALARLKAAVSADPDTPLDPVRKKGEDRDDGGGARMSA